MNAICLLSFYVSDDVGVRARTLELCIIAQKPATMGS